MLMLDQSIGLCEERGGSDIVVICLFSGGISLLLAFLWGDFSLCRREFSGCV